MGSIGSFFSAERTKKALQEKPTALTALTPVKVESSESSMDEAFMRELERRLKEQRAGSLDPLRS
jgi:hypothetical protein